MPQMSKRLVSVTPAGRTGWEVHFLAEARRAAGADVIMCSIGDHDFPTPEPSVEACVAAVRAGHHHYTGLAGRSDLLAAMARASQRSTGVATTVDNVIATVGGQGALFAAVQAASDPGDHAIVVGPYYATYPGTFSLSGVDHTVVEARAEDDFQPERAALEAALRPGTRLILINSPNNPTGAVYARQTLEAIAAFCRDNDLWLVSDEVYWTHTGAAGRHLSPLALPDMEERTLVVNSVSKSHAMTGWRVGWLRGPAPVIRRLAGFNLVVTYGIGDFVSRAVAEALDNDWGVAEVTATYERRRAMMIEALAQLDGVVVRGSCGGIYVMLDVRAIEADGERFALQLLEAENVAVMPGESFGRAATGHVRISLCQPDPVLAEAAARIARFITNHGSLRKRAAGGTS
ncbi:MAG: aminotransferase [Alphaproteobacteria bacterium]|nr:MAG: aminotransferase [Alphaproteobacteria bacterium]